MSGEQSQIRTCPLRTPYLQREANIKQIFRDFSGSPMAKIPCSQCRGLEFDPWSGNKIPQAVMKCSDAATKDPVSYLECQHKKKKKKKKELKNNIHKNECKNACEGCYKIADRGQKNV